MEFTSSRQWTADIKSRVAKSEHTLQDLFLASGISRATWSNWRLERASPTMNSMARVETVIRDWEENGAHTNNQA